MSWKIMAGMGLALALVLAAGLLYFDWSQKEFAKLNKDLAETKVVVAIQDQTISDLNTHMENVKVLSEDLDARLRSIRNESNTRAAPIVNPNLPRDAVTKPRETEVMINTFTKDLFDDLEVIGRGENPQGE